MASLAKAVPRSVLSLTALRFSPFSHVVSRNLSSGAVPLTWKLFHGMLDFETRMTAPLPHIPAPAAAPISVKRGAVQISKLSNGLTVASQDMGAAQIASVALFVDAGSRYETERNRGVSHLVEKMAFKGTTSKSKFAFTKEMDKLGASFGSAAARETIAFSGEGLRADVEAIVSAVADAATSPAVFNYSKGPAYEDVVNAEIKITQNMLIKEVADIMKDPANIVMEALHDVAFGGGNLGLPLAAEERKLKALTAPIIADYIKTYFTANRMVLSGCNVNHEEFVAFAKEAFEHLPKASSAAPVKAKYIGGSTRLSGDGLAQVALGFEGVSWSDKDLVPICVLHTLLGGGGSFSSGGPGKGMYTRLYTNVLNQHPWVHSALAFNNVYSDTGLFGFSGASDPEMLSDLITVITEQAMNMASNLSQKEVSRAKNQTKSSLIMNLESRAVVCEDIGRQLLSTGKYVGPEELVKQIDAITQHDLERVAARIISSKPSLVVYGDMHEVPSYELISASLSKKALK